VTVAFNITRDDLLKYLIASYSRSRTLKKTYLRGFIWGPVIGMIAVAINRVPEAATAAAIVLGSTGIYAAIWHLYWPRRLSRIGEAILDEGIMRNELGHHTISLEPEGIPERADWGDVFRKWRVIGAVNVTEGHVMVDVTEQGPVIVVPTKAFTDADARDTFVQAVRKAVGAEQPGT
jgi:hypothetical protein